MVDRSLNSYTLERLDGTPIPGNFSARRLRGFTPRDGTKLAEEQVEVEQRVANERLEAADDETTADQGVDEEAGSEQPQTSRADTRSSQAARTPPHEGGAHGVVGDEGKSRDATRDLACDLAP